MKTVKLTSMVLAIVMVFGLLAGSAFAKGESSITLGMWPEDTQTEAIATHQNYYVPAFQEKHPDVEIIPSYYKYAPDTYVALATAGNAPTVFESWYTEPEKLIRNGLVKDITDLLEERGWLDAMSPAIRDLLSDEDGRVYGVPRDAYSLGLMINVSLFEQAGLVNEDGSVNFTNNEVCKAALEIYKTMALEGVLVEVNTWDEYCGTFSNGTAGSAINGCWILGTVMGVPDQSGKWALTNMPKMTGFETATNYSNNGGSSWVFTNGTDIDLALDFMQAYRNVDFYNTILPTTSAIGTWAGAKEGSNYTAGNEYFNGDAIFAKIVEFTAHVPANQTGAFYYDARDALGTALTNYINGGDLDTELANAEDTVNFAMGF